MPPIDVDPKALAAGAAASAHAYEQAIVHVGEEINARDPNNLDALVGSLAPEGPYAYTILPQVKPDGSIRLPVLITREEIAEAYAFIRGASDLHEVIGLTEVRGAWYLFQDGISVGSPKGSDVRNNRHTLAIFPSGAGRGITGELVWLRTPRSALGAGDETDVADPDPLLARKQVFDQYARYLAALRANDIDGVVETLHDGVVSAVRDYVDGSGTLAEVNGKDEHRAWYDAFFATYEVRSVQTLTQVTEDWYLFAELRITVSARDSDGELAFNTAEFHIPAKDGRFIVRVGHGTELAG
jgi:ketosteroid isomerase-like protein